MLEKQQVTADPHCGYPTAMETTMHPMLMYEHAKAHAADLLGLAERYRRASPAPPEANGRNAGSPADVGTLPVSYGAPHGRACENSISGRGPSWSGGP